MSAAAAIAAIALLGPIGADRAAAAKSTLDFHQCGREGHEAFECARMTVPLKLAAGRPRQAADAAAKRKRQRIRIHVERLKSTRDGGGALLALAGGPGQAATDFSAQFAEQLAPMYERTGQQLVTIDQRGTGRSGFLSCKALDDEEPSGQGMVATRRCSRQVGPGGRWYRTADSVADIQKLRRKLGVKRLSVYGVSYGTVVAGQYARTYPSRVRSLVLDSVFNGWDPLQRPSFDAAPRVLEAFCADGACAGITGDPVGDTAALVERTEQGEVTAQVVDPSAGFRRVSEEIKSVQLFNTLQTTDLNPGLRALWPAALAAAGGGDTAPVGRLVAIGAGDGGSAAEDGSISTALNFATNCADTPNPWSTRISIPLRKQATGELIDSNPASTWAPFNPAAAYGGTLATQCRGWGFGPQRGALTERRLPDVPALLLEGEVDVRTPISTMEGVAAELPRSAATIIANQGHSVLGGECAQDSLIAWVSGEPVPGRCEQAATPNQEIPATSLDEYSAPTQSERTFDAAHDTILEDALTLADVLQYAGLQTIGGLRAGAMAIEVADGRLELELRGYSLVPGVRVSGQLTAGGDAPRGRFEVRGRSASDGTLRLVDGELKGRLGDQRFERRLDAEQRRQLRTADEAEPPPAALP